MNLLFQELRQFIYYFQYIIMLINNVQKHHFDIITDFQDSPLFTDKMLYKSLGKEFYINYRLSIKLNSEDSSSLFLFLLFDNINIYYCKQTFLEVEHFNKISNPAIEFQSTNKLLEFYIENIRDKKSRVEITKQEGI